MVPVPVATQQDQTEKVSPASPDAHLRPDDGAHTEIVARASEAHHASEIEHVGKGERRHSHLGSPLRQDLGVGGAGQQREGRPRRQLHERERGWGRASLNPTSRASTT